MQVIFEGIKCQAHQLSDETRDYIASLAGVCGGFEKVLYLAVPDDPRWPAGGCSVHALLTGDWILLDGREKPVGVFDNTTFQRLYGAPSTPAPTGEEIARLQARVKELEAQLRVGELEAQLRDGEPPRERFGWLGILGDGEIRRAVSGLRLGRIVDGEVPVTAGKRASDFREIRSSRREFGAEGFDRRLGDLLRFDSAAVVDFEGLGHFSLQPLSPEARLSCIDDSNNTHIACNCNEKIFIGGRHGAYGAKPSNVGKALPQSMTGQ